MGKKHSFSTKNENFVVNLDQTLYTIWFIFILETPNTHHIFFKNVRRDIFKDIWVFSKASIEVHARIAFSLILHKTSGFSRRRKTNTPVAARESVVRSRGLSGDEVCLQSFHSRWTKRAKVGRGVIQVLWVAREFNPTTEHPKDHKGHGKRESTVTGIQVCVCVRLRDP